MKSLQFLLISAFAITMVQSSVITIEGTNSFSVLVNGTVNVVHYTTEAKESRADYSELLLLAIAIGIAIVVYYIVNGVTKAPEQQVAPFEVGVSVVVNANDYAIDEDSQFSDADAGEAYL